jgi:hypothetical protein
MPVPGADVRIEPMTGVHAAAVLAIYQAGIEEGNARLPGSASSAPGSASASTAAAGATSS